jgi:hypothetical protein
MKKLRLIFAVTLFFILGIFGVIHNVIEGHPIQATLFSLPVLMVTLAIIFPGRGPGYFALTHKFGPIKEENESEKQFHLKMAKWWFFGFITSLLPLLLLSLLPRLQGELIEGGIAIVAFIIGFPCFIKLIESLINAFKAK